MVLADKTNSKFNTMATGLYNLINFKKSLIVLMLFILIDIVFTYFDAQDLKAGQPHIGESESAFELISMFIFLLVFILFIIFNYPKEKERKFKWAIVPSIAFIWTFVYYIIIYILNFMVLYPLFA